MTALAFPLQVSASDTVLWMTDSYVEGWGSSGGLGGGLGAALGWRVQAEQINRARNDVPLVVQPNWSGLEASRLYPITSWYTNAISGTGMANAAANFNTRVLPYNPTLIFMLLSRNDVGGNMTTWQTNADLFAAQMASYLANTRVCFISAFLGFSEKWDNVLGWDPAVGQNANISNLNNTCQTWLTGQPDSRYIYMNLRGTALGQADTILQYEQVNNPAPVVGSTVGLDFGPDTAYGPLLTDSSGHPTRGFGCYQIAQMLWNYIEVVP